MEVLQAMQSVLTHWDGLLQTTGGALEMTKSYWYLIDYAFCQGRWVYCPPSATPGNLSLHNDATGLAEPITRLHVGEARKALGIFSCPRGTMKAEKEYLRSKAKIWAHSFQSIPPGSSDAWYCLTSMIMKTIKYPLVTTSFTRKECAYIMALILTSGSTLFDCKNASLKL